jgi:hypothetical protein
LRVTAWIELKRPGIGSKRIFIIPLLLKNEPFHIRSLSFSFLLKLFWKSLFGSRRTDIRIEGILRTLVPGRRSRCGCKTGRRSQAGLLCEQENAQ